MGAGVASNGAEPAVETTLNRYFQGINTHDYAQYQSAHDAAEQATEPQSNFTSGYASTTDSGMTLVSLASTANGGESATVTFTSHQAAGSSIDGSTCNNWQLTFFLVPRGAASTSSGPLPPATSPSTRTAERMVVPVAARWVAAALGALLVLSGWQSVIGTLIVPRPLAS